MNLTRSTLTILFVLFVSACGAPEPIAIPSGPIGTATSDVTIRAVAPRYTVTEVRVAVPQTLRVSEANSFHPNADVVWRGEPSGDRLAQVAAILNEAAADATRNMTVGPAVIVDITLTRFHALTEKTRYTIGGVHSIRFDLTVRDAVTGAAIDGPRRIVADVKAAGGAKAISEDEEGRTQRVIIVERLTQVLTRELTEPPVR
jgi:hypothetical protein